MTTSSERLAIRREILKFRPGETFQTYQIAQETGLSTAKISAILKWYFEDLVDIHSYIPGSRQHLWRRK